MRLPCPTCKRRGTVDKAYPPGTLMMYCDKDGNRCPQEMCQTCNGSGWIYDGHDAKPGLSDYAANRLGGLN